MFEGGGGEPGHLVLHRCELLERNNNRSVYRKEKTAACHRVGSASNKGSQAGATFDIEGLFQNICACTHGYAIGNIIEANYSAENFTSTEKIYVMKE